MKSFTLAATAAYLLLSPAEAAGLYTKGSPVLQVDGSNYDRLIAKSNHTSIVEFYAPWCGHCQNLKPAYEKAAKSLEGLAKVAAVNCDAEENKPLCGRFGIQGFPTLKIIRPGKKPGKPTVEDYQGPRSAKGITDAVVDKIPNHVKKIKDSELEGFLEKDNSTAKAILFTEKGTTSALLRALAIDFLGSINVAQIRNKEAKAVETFGVTKFPQLILLPGGDKEGLVYDGDMKKEPMVKFLSQAASPNPDPAPGAEKPKKPKSSKAKKAKSETPESAKPREQEPIIPEDASAEEAQAPPQPVDTKPPAIPQIQAGAELQTACLSPTHGVCLLALLKQSPEGDEPTVLLLESLNGIAFKHAKRDGKIFPFYAVPHSEAQDALRQQLGLTASGENELVATNGKRAWFKRYAGEGYGPIAVEAWIDAIRMGEGKKQKFPEGVVVEAAEPVPAAEPEPEPEPQPQEEDPVRVEVVEEIVEETAPHDEL